MTEIPRTAARPATRAVPAACIVAVALSLAAVACAPDDPVADSQPDVVVDTIGDTIVVRTNSGSVWGADATLDPEVSIGEFEGPEEYLFGAVAAIAVDGDQNVFVLDWQAQEIRQYDAFGDYVGRLARRGEGPGELSLADAMAFLPDGRLVVPDQRNGRINLFGPQANQTDEWPLQTYNPLRRASPMDRHRRSDLHPPPRGIRARRGHVRGRHHRPRTGRNASRHPSGPRGRFRTRRTHRQIRDPGGWLDGPNGPGSLQSRGPVGGPPARRNRVRALQRIPHRSAARGSRSQDRARRRPDSGLPPPNGSTTAPRSRRISATRFPTGSGTDRRSRRPSRSSRGCTADGTDGSGWSSRPNSETPRTPHSARRCASTSSSRMEPISAPSRRPRTSGRRSTPSSMATMSGP